MSAERSDSGPWPYLPWLVPAIAVLSARLQVNDLAYQLRAGQIMWAEHLVLRTDRFTYTVSGEPWLNQQWGAQALLWPWFSLFGWKGLVALQAALVTGSYGATYLVCRRAGASAAVAAVTTLAGFAVAVSVPGALALRPQLLAVPLFVASAWLIRERQLAPRRLAALPLLAIVWANIHGSFVLLPVMLVIALIADALARSPATSRTALVLVLALVAPLVTPWGADTYRYLWEIGTDPTIRTVISEWRPLITQPVASALLVTALVGAAAVVWRQRSRNPTIEEALVLIMFTVLALESARNVVWWSVAIPPATCALLAGWRPGGAWGIVLTRTVVAALVIVIAIAAGRVARSEPRALLSEAPAGITAWLASRPPSERIFAEWWAPWFEYALPDRPMFTDARVELFPDPIWQDYGDIVNATPDLAATLGRWNVDTVVVAADHHPELVAALSSDHAWTLAYRDADGTVFTRT